MWPPSPCTLRAGPGDACAHRLLAQAPRRAHAENEHGARPASVMGMADGTVTEHQLTCARSMAVRPPAARSGGYYSDPGADGSTRS
jgi:hypothetical protein